MYNNASFVFSHNVSQNQPHVQYENLHVIQIQPHQIGLAFEGSQPYLMTAGIWTKNSALFNFVGFRLATDMVIEHGSITRYVVENGQIGFAWQDGLVSEIDPGIGVVDNPNFKFEHTAKLSDEVIQFGNIAPVTTREGYNRPIFVDGKLQI